MIGASLSKPRSLASSVQACAASFTGEMAARSFASMLMEQQTVTNPAVIAWFVCHDETLNQQCMLTQAHPTMINHLTSTGADLGFHEGGFIRLGALARTRKFLQTTPTFGQKPRSFT